MMQDTAWNKSSGSREDDGSGRICKKCLIRDLPEAEYFHNLYDYIARLPQEDKVPDALYQERLSYCMECEYLLSGMCRICGCYVELRAAMRVRSCPGNPKRW